MKRLVLALAACGMLAPVSVAQKQMVDSVAANSQRCTDLSGEVVPCPAGHDRTVERSPKNDTVVSGKRCVDLMGDEVQCPGMPSASSTAEPAGQPNPVSQSTAANTGTNSAKPVSMPRGTATPESPLTSAEEAGCNDLQGQPVSCPRGKVSAKAARTERAAFSKPVAQPSAIDNIGAETSPEIAAYSEPSHRPVSLERSLPKNLYLGQKDFWTFPARLRLDDASWGVPFGIATGALIAADNSIKKELPTDPNTIKRFDNLSNYGALAFGGLVGGSYLLGRWTHNDHLKDTAWLAGEAGANGFITTYALKTILGRQRPDEGNGKGDFFSGGQSFPSEHAAAAWSVATVFANRYPGTFTKLFMYGGASTISASRIIAQKHFSSDVFVGSALGWYFGHQALKRYEREHVDDRSYGSFLSTPGESRSDTRFMGSPYVPLDSWVYPVFDRLVAMGYVHTGFLGMRPWTRLECARLVSEALETSGELGDSNVAQSYLESLGKEFAYEQGLMRGERNLQASVDSIYSRMTNISGKPLNDSYHFGQTIYNDFGRPYQEGFNAISGASASAQAGPFAIYIRGEYQHSPSAPGLPLAARKEIAHVDNLPLPPDDPYKEVNQGKILEAYASVNLADWQLSFGRQSLWWGPGVGGALMFSNNARPFPMVKLDRTKPIKAPGWLGGLLGPIRTQFIFGQLEGHRFIDLRPVTPVPTLLGSWNGYLDLQPFIHASIFSLKPTPNLEMSVLLGAEFSGEGVPLTTLNLLRTLHNYSTGPHNNGNRETGFQFRYRIPGLRNWLTLYTDSMAEDEPNPIAYPRRSAMNPGVYLSHVPHIPRLDLRVEGVYTDLPGLRGSGLYYTDYHFREGWTSDSNILGSWIGRQGTGIQAWSTYWLNSTDRLQFEYRNSRVSDGFISYGGDYRDFGIKADLFNRHSTALNAQLQYESWKFRVLDPSEQSNLAVSIQVTYRPKHKLK